jgi:hypothetical protein
MEGQSPEETIGIAVTETIGGLIPLALLLLVMYFIARANKSAGSTP